MHKNATPLEFPCI